MRLAIKTELDMRLLPGGSARCGRRLDAGSPGKGSGYQLVVSVPSPGLTGSGSKGALSRQTDLSGSAYRAPRLKGR